MTLEQFFQLCVETVEELRSQLYIPYDTGNLARNALRYRIEGTKFIVYIDEEIAPYMPYTNEPWLSPRWRGKKNPNEGWWARWCKLFMQRLAQKLKGDIKE